MLSGLATFSQIKGCSRGEIHEIREVSEYPLPKAYEAFLAVMGWGAGCFFRGTDIFYPAVLGNRCLAEEILKDDGNPFTLSPDQFVFATHQGYQFLYFQNNEDDPPVYHYLEGERPVKLAERFSEYLLMCVNDYEEIQNLPVS
jgi:hypothetical protein